MSRAPACVLGIDTALRKSGLAVLEEQRQSVRVLDVAVVRCPPAWPVTRCLQALVTAIEERIERFHPTVMVVEGIFFCRNARTAIRLGEARGAVLSCAVRAGIPVYEYEPRRVKKAIVGWGQADKTQVNRMISARLNLAEPPEEDAADAMAIALCHLQRSGSDIEGVGSVPL